VVGFTVVDVVVGAGVFDGGVVGTVVVALVRLSVVHAARAASAPTSRSPRLIASQSVIARTFAAVVTSVVTGIVNG
jgi:hypothetical protein